MRATTLHAALWSYADEAATLLRCERDAGAELPFDVVESGSREGRTPLYCYRPMTAEFIAQRTAMLAQMPATAAARDALLEIDGLDRWLHSQGQAPPRGLAGQADAVLECFLLDVLGETTDFELDSDRFARCYDTLETSLLSGESLVEVLALVSGIELESDEVPLADGLALVVASDVESPPDELASLAPRAVLARWVQQRRAGEGPTPAHAREWVRRLLTPLRLYADGDVTIAPLGWVRQDGGRWRALALADDDRGSEAPVPVGQLAEDELRAFCNLITRRLPRTGEVAWALRRYELGCERASPAEALTDHLLALRALLEPEGPASGRLAGRLAALCAVPTRRRELGARIAHAVALERTIVAGLAPAGAGLREAADELAAHLRALLRDVLCGHLDSDLRALADELIEEEAERLGSATGEQLALDGDERSELVHVTG